MDAWPVERERLTAAGPVLAVRAAVLQAIRAFFARQGFLEVETPVHTPVPMLELHIDAMASESAFLRTSPELHMKKLVAAGQRRLFQLGPCFRRGERGRFHNPEYTMLEWYRADAGYLDVLRDAEMLLRDVAAAAVGAPEFRWQGARVDLAAPWARLTVEDAFERYAGWNPVTAYDADRFDLDLVGKVEPALPRDRPVVLMDYPAGAAALARLKPGSPAVAERWELYLAGVELANAYGELTDPAEQRARFAGWASARKAMGHPEYPVDENFLAALADMPPTAGIALGVDRLVMLLADAPSLDRVLPFREPTE